VGEDLRLRERDSKAASPPSLNGRALGHQTPLAVVYSTTTTTADHTVFNSRLKAKLSQLPAPLDHRVRRDKIDSFGKVPLRYLGKLRHFPVGVEHKNRRVSLSVAGPDVRIITTDGELIRRFHARPNSQLPAARRRWPVHNVLPQACTMS
jgi:hypothetical protein